ncbi:MAG: 3-oxoacyl-ACP reductase FabG [Gammaproteobacteria bacterium]
MTERRTALVTGASRGIGRAIADSLAAQGLQVIGTSTTAAGAAALDATLKAHGSDHVGLQLDVTEPASVNALFETLAARALTPLVLVNNAGITRDNLLLRMKDEEWRQVIDADLGSIFTLSKHCVRAMIKARWGRIVNITSVVGASGNAGQANYAAAKAGVIGFTKSLAQEVAARGVTVNAVAPGMIDTDMTRALNDAQRAALLARIPAGRLGAAEEIAAAVAFLASEQAAYITGETLHVNGGMYMA